MASQSVHHRNAASGATPYEPMDKMASATLKRSPKMDLNKNDLLRLLSYLEGELQARDISIATLKAEKAKQLLYQAKYGRFGLGDPFHALQRDSDAQKDNSFDESAVKAMYDNQLLQLENLIETQRKAQLRMREQLVAVEKRYHKVCAELESEQRKHAQDTAQGDDVTYLLEKERERLKQELEFEKGQNKKLEKESKKALASLEEEKSLSCKHKQVAVMLIRERKRLVEKLVSLQQHIQEMESGGSDSAVTEAALERQLAEFDVEREQMRAKLKREENKSEELADEVLRLKAELEAAQRAQGARMAGVNPRVNPPQIFRNTPPSTPPEVRKLSTTTVSPVEGVERTVIGEHKPEKQVFSSSSGTTRISLNVGSSVNNQRPNRGVPPPVPPNKPQVYIPPSPQSGQTARPFSGGVAPCPSPKPVNPASKFGITISKDRISISSDSTRPDVASRKPSSSSSTSSSNASSSNSSPHQVCVQLK